MTILRSLIFRALTFVLIVGAVNIPVLAKEPTAVPWNRCCGGSPWPHAQGMTGGGTMGGGMMGSMPRQHVAMMRGVPAPYNTFSNPLLRTKTTVDRGGEIYAANCASCHGPTGQGDGEAARGLSPPPANLLWFSQMPMSRWDGFMYWTIAEGGAPFGTAMPAFKKTLSKNDLWSVIAYVQAQLPLEPAQR